MGGNAVRPKLVLDGAAAAIAFYQEALSAREVARFTSGNTAVFAELDVLGTSITLKDADDTDHAAIQEMLDKVAD